MERSQAERVVESLRARRVFAHVRGSGLYEAGIAVIRPDGTEVVWDVDGAAGLEAQVLRDGVLVDFVPTIEGSESFDETQTADAIAAHEAR
jgi:hypothetical protein